MAYKPPIYRGRSNAQRFRPAVSRQALVEALAARLAMLLGDEPVFPPRPEPRANPIIPPRPPFRGEPAIPPRGPFRGEPAGAPVEPRTFSPPPSAWDWVRRPGFYDEDRAPVRMGGIEEDGSFSTSAGMVWDPELQGYRRPVVPFTPMF